MKIIKLLAIPLLAAIFLAGCAHTTEPNAGKYCKAKSVTKVHKQKYTK